MERFEEYTARGLKKDGSWSVGFFLYQDGKTFIYGRGVNDDFKAEVLPETVGRFTCQHDRFLNKIFEGDIVKKTKTDAICTVKWSGGKCAPRLYPSCHREDVGGYDLSSNTCFNRSS